MPSRPFRLSNVATFQGIAAADLARLEAGLSPIDVARGQLIVSEGDDADALFVVVSGRFAVEIAGNADPVTEIGQGATIGEIAFFAGGKRTASVRAIRDSVVVRLSRADFDAISARAPAIWNAIAATLAARLAAETRKTTDLRASAASLANAHTRTRAKPRTIALIAAGPAALPERFIAALTDVALRSAGTLVVSSRTIGDHTNERADGDAVSLEALNELETRYALIVFIADTALTPWSEKVIRQADAIVSAGVHPDGPLGSAVALSPVEAFAATLHRPEAHRIALLHVRRGGVQGTRHWLAPRQFPMHHHIARDSHEDVARLWRFVTGAALGFVACGGGAYCAAHIGVYKAFRDNGIVIDFYGGTSGGAAMAAAFAQDIAPDDIAARIDRMFIKGKALARYTVPRYSLLDHSHFDRHLQNEYGNVRIEDMWLPYFAVSADLASAALEVHRAGPVWQAIRASAAIPGLLPPFASDDGRMLVDGSVIANVPVEVMHALKSGPNVVVSFEAPGAASSGYDYQTLPERAELIRRTLNPFSSASWPDAPSAATVLVRSLMANRGRYETHLGPDDWLLVPPHPANMGALDWRRHIELAAAAEAYTKAEIAARYQSGHQSGRGE